MVVEMEIPFKTLRFNSNETQTWGINIVRTIVRKREEAYWAPIARELGSNGKFRAEYFGDLTGLHSLAQPEKYQIKPFLLTGLEKNYAENG